MSRVLVVDDEPRYRDHISRALVRDGHDVRTAATGREAIALGSEFRPQLLIADWMLKDHLHGLHVSEALRAVVPALGTILITGFPSSDLREDARSLQVTEFLEKPFEMARLRDAVRAVTSASLSPLDRSPIAVFDIDRNGAIRHSNERARQLCSQAGTPPAVSSFWALMDFEDSNRITAATHEWITVVPRSAPRLRWHLRAKEHGRGQGWLLVIIPDDQQHHKSHPVVQMLLDLEPTPLVRWPFKGRTLIVDDDQWVRHVVAEQIECGGGVCHTAESAETALRTCERDSGIEVVVIDHDLPGESAQDFVRRLRELRPNARLVGTSGFDRSREFARMGVGGFLLKPWTMTDLVNLLGDRLGHCDSCGTALPLRRPRPGEPSRAWRCTGCGSTHWAVLDQDFPSDILKNVRAGDEPGR